MLNVYQNDRRYDERDLLMQDFMTVETVAFPKSGSSTTPAHSFSDFTFRTFAPLAFRYFLQLFSVKKDDFMVRERYRGYKTIIFGGSRRVSKMLNLQSIQHNDDIYDFWGQG